MDVIYKLPKKNGGASAEGYVRYDQEQELTDEQKQQAKENLGIDGPVPSASLIETTYGELKAMRDNGELVPGTFYRITDYECTTTDEETQSAGHVFDIIVQALSESTLSEDARAIQHEDDTYFADSNLAAWKLKYCLDNDTVRFGWADETDGKGVVYRMIDEFGNDVAYDFKNIMFKRYQISECSVNDNLVGLYLGMPDSDWHENDTTRFKYMYTFCAIDADWECHDLSILGNNGTVTDPNAHDTGCKNNVFKPAFEKPGNSRNLECQMLNNGVFVTEFAGPWWHYCGCSGNRTGVGCRNWTYSDKYVDNGNPKTEYYHSSPWTCGNDCNYWMITGGLSYWTADDNAQSFYINSDGGMFRLLSGLYGGKVIPENLYMKTIGFDSDDNLRVWNIADEPELPETSAVLYTAQTLTDEQKQQARENIGAEIARYSFNDSDEFISNFADIKQNYDVGINVECVIAEVTTNEYNYETYESVKVTLCLNAHLILMRAAQGAHSSRIANFIGFANVQNSEGDYKTVSCYITIERPSGDLVRAVLSPASPYGVAPSDIDGKQYCIKNGKWTEIAGDEAVQSDWNETDTDDPAFIKNKPTIPTVNNPTVTIKQGGTTKGTFTLNQGSAATIDLEAGGGEAVQSDWNETDTDDPAFIKNKPTIPTVNNPTVTIKQGGTTKGTFTLNQGSAATIDLEAGGGEAVQSDWNETDTDDPAFIKNKPTIPTVNNPTVTIKQGGTTKGTFTLNQGSAATIDLDADTGTILIDTMSMMDEGGTISWSDMEDYGLSRSAYDGLPLGAIVTCTVQANKSLPIEYAPMSIRKLDANTGKAFAFAFLKNGSSMIAARCTITFEPDVVTAEFDTRILS